MRRIHERIVISNKSGKEYLTSINQFNLEEGLSGIDTPILLIGEKTLYPFSDYQTQHDMRMEQMINKTILKTYKGHIPTGKGFKIINISRGKIPGVPDKFNGYIMLLERVY